MSYWSFKNIVAIPDTADTELNEKVSQILTCAGAKLNKPAFVGNEMGEWFSEFAECSSDKHPYDDGILSPEELFYTVQLVSGQNRIIIFFEEEEGDDTSDSGSRIEKRLTTTDNTLEQCKYSWEYGELRGSIKIKTTENYFGIKPSKKKIAALLKRSQELGYTSLTEVLEKQ